MANDTSASMEFPGRTIQADDLLDSLEELEIEVDADEIGEPVLLDANGQPVETWREDYPYDERMTRREYDRTKRLLQIELLKLQSWIKDTDRRLVLLFEGRDAAGKGGTIRSYTEHLNPRGARVVALQKPTEVQRTQWYFQRYIEQLPSAGEIVFFDRSWYNRAGVERVMGFCNNEDCERFMVQAPQLERMLVEDGIDLIKFWFSVTQSEQRTRFTLRRVDPVKQWKLSPIDLDSLDKWDAYTAAKNRMFRCTHTAHAPWTVVKSNDKRRGRLESMRYVLSCFDYAGKDKDIVGTPDPLIVGPPDTVHE
jgi:polyphosphate kinase